ncbi:hypothetical protein CN311_25640 [Mesorhizobium sanjuanii]|uniref:Uncharacterized protein n=1 Tax=Mesorhizobium sanjuanii TaxID=2037900 RepID=A0A2A6F981_9HYPH|nr:hypothetical protein CN311_25640 [Mesorhizobium sanjuanii]
MARQIKNDLAPASVVQPASTAKRQGGAITAKSSNQRDLPRHSRHDNASTIGQSSGPIPAATAEDL